MGVLDKRLLGPIKNEMGGDPQGGSGGGGGSSLTIQNNVDGYVLRATGQANTVKGIPELRWNEAQTALTGSADMYISGSNNYLYLHGSDADGNTVRFKVKIDGSLMRVQADDPEGSI